MLIANSEIIQKPNVIENSMRTFIKNNALHE